MYLGNRQQQMYYAPIFMRMKPALVKANINNERQISCIYAIKCSSDRLDMIIWVGECTQAWMIVKERQKFNRVRQLSVGILLDWRRNGLIKMMAHGEIWITVNLQGRLWFDCCWGALVWTVKHYPLSSLFKECMQVQSWHQVVSNYINGYSKYRNMVFQRGRVCISHDIWFS